MFKTVLILSSVLAFAASQVTTPGRCDETVQVVQDFDVEAYTGLWYESYRIEQFQQFAGDCVTARYTLQENGVEVFNRMVLFQVALNITGVAVLDPSAAPGEGKLLVTFPTVNQTSPYWVLSTNYDSYALVYLCQNLGEERRQISSWMLSRTPLLDPLDILAITEAMENVDGLEWGLFRYTDQSAAACEVRSN